MSYDVDVILPTHRDDGHLFRSIESVLKSEGVQARLIIVDDRQDQTKKLNIDERKEIIMVSTGGNTGYNNAVRVGVREATASYVAFQDSDDLSHPRRLKKQIDALMASDADVSYCKMQSISNNGVKLFHYLQKIREPDFLGYSLLLGSYGANSTWVFRCDAIKKIDFNRSERSFDWAIALKDFVDLNIVHCNEPLYFYRKHLGQMTRDPRYMQESLFEIYQLWADLNKKMGLPHLGYSDFNALVNPWKSADLGPNVYTWLKALRKMIIEQPKSSLLFYKIIYFKIFVKADKKSKIKLISEFPKFLVTAFLYTATSVLIHSLSKGRRIEY